MATTTVWTTRMRTKTAPSQLVPPTSFSARRADASPTRSVAIRTTIAGIPPTRRAASTLLATLRSSPATMDAAFRPRGNATLRTTVVTAAMKEVITHHGLSPLIGSLTLKTVLFFSCPQISALKGLALISSSLALVPATAFRSRGCATATTTASITKTRKDVRPSRVPVSS